MLKQNTDLFSNDDVVKCALKNMQMPLAKVISAAAFCVLPVPLGCGI